MGQLDLFPIILRRFLQKSVQEDYTCRFDYIVMVNRKKDRAVFIRPNRNPHFIEVFCRFKMFYKFRGNVANALYNFENIVKLFLYLQRQRVIENIKFRRSENDADWRILLRLRFHATKITNWFYFNK